MQITASISLNVDDVTAAATFFKQHFGFSEEMSADVSLSRQDAGFNLIFLRTGLATLNQPICADIERMVCSLLFVDDIDREYARLQAEGVSITTAIETESWGERFFQVTDPNGVVLQLVQWDRAKYSAMNLGHN